jgi:hypothetical protein
VVGSGAAISEAGIAEQSSRQRPPSSDDCGLRWDPEAVVERARLLDRCQQH